MVNATPIIIANASAISRIPSDHPRTALRRFVPRPLKNQPPKITRPSRGNAVSNSYSHGLAEGQQMIKNNKDQHDGREKKTGLPRHGVAKKTRSELQKPRVGNETHCNETEPRDDHKRSSLTVYVAHHRCGPK